MDIEYQLNANISHDDLNALYSSAWPNHTPMDFTQELAHAYITVTAYHEGRLVGFVKIIWDGGQHGFILEPTVHQDFQRRGIGSKLLQHLIMSSREKGLKWLHVDFESDLDAYYRKAGFVHTDAGLYNLTGEA